MRLHKTRLHGTATNTVVAMAKRKQNVWDLKEEQFVQFQQ